MNDKEVLSGTVLYELDIFDQRGILKVGRLNGLLRAFLKSNASFSKAEEIIETLKRYNGSLTVLVDETIRQYTSKLENVKSFIEQVENDSRYEMIDFEIATKQTKKVPFYFNFKKCHPGLYELKHKGKNQLMSSFDEDFQDVDLQLRNKLLSAGFDGEMKLFRPERFRIVKDAKVHAFSKDVTTVSFQEKGVRCIDENFRGRTLVKFNASLIEQSQTMETALFLPLQSAINNYYHNLSETVFGLRLLKLFPADIPIVYRGAKRFEVVPFYAEKLGVDPQRLIPIETLEGVRVKKAVLIHKDGFFWTKAHYEFFRQFIDQEVMPFRKVYISRNNSKRALTNENEIEHVLEAHGFDIIYAERLTFEEQVKLFSETELLVSGHGAGLANILFMQSGTKLIEIFHEHFLKSDYYQRSVHNQMGYQLMMTDKTGKLNVSELLEKMALLLKES
ncbi:MAG: glycosyltransferase family 61 protein [Defluviitaleaceae bacterium]|nr:glycosyltransferase family 61 protein [Defluviitaleaceae bacterium]